MHKETISYTDGTTNYKGYIAYKEPTEGRKRPIVLVCPTWHGLNTFIKDKTESLAELGCVAFALDLYGEGQNPHEVEEARQLMQPLFENRKELRRRLNLGLDFIKKEASGHESSIAAIGFCFGGTCVLELAKSGASLKGVVSFHGVLGNPRKLSVQWEPTANKIISSVLVLTGKNDPFVPQEDITSFENEMTTAQADWQIVTYGNACHSFMIPDANNVESGMCYHPLVSKRAWKAMQNFLKECFYRTEEIVLPIQA